MEPLGTLGNYIVLIVAIACIGLFWALTSSTSKKDIVSLVVKFTIWSVICYTIQNLSGLHL